MGTHQSAAIRSGAERLATRREERIEELPQSADLRRRARAIRLHALSHLDRLLGHFADRAEESGAHVHFAGDAEEARRIVARILGETGSRSVVKSKSMVTEEIDLNAHLIDEGFQVVETDLGEFIVQLSQDRPSHIIAPVLHRSRADIGELFSEKLGVAYTDDAHELNRIARRHLRPFFLEADAGITGVNLAVAETGSLVLVTNEGNGRLVSSGPRVHIAVMGMERVVPRWIDATAILELLARSATGQRLSAYTSVVTGPRRSDDEDGPGELHVVVVDNGRSQILAGENAEILACIRCGACLNVCPVFREVGGHAYGGVYSGPVGAVLTPGLLGMEGWWDLAHASTLCGACEEVCPVGIQIPKMLLQLRRAAASEGRLPRWLGRGVAAYTKAATDPARWAKVKRWVRSLSAPLSAKGWIRSVPGPGRGWTSSRDFPRPAKQSFTEWWEEQNGS